MKNILPDRVIENSFCLLFFLVPLLLTPYNYELFEFNKMMLTYSLTVVITSAWIIKMIMYKKLIFKRTPFDFPLILFLMSQIVSSYFSIDPHVSLFGYYSRFNGGLFSIISYSLLFYAFAANFPTEKIIKLFKFIFFSAVLVSVYGVLERMGIDKNLWVQDVQNRVFSTLGQPNWLAAYLAILIPLSFQVNHKFKLHNLIMISLFFSALLFTKSRSGFLGLSFGLFSFWILNFYIHKAKILKSFLIFVVCYLLLVFISGSPFRELNRFTLPGLTKSQQNQTANEIKPAALSVIDTGITESGQIRNIVWRGALEIFKKYPFIGTGVETFAFSYFKFRPPQHNMTSEWDYLYNKAHNEYLNFAATTGIFGLGSYLLIIFVFIFWFLNIFLHPLKSVPVLILPDDKKFLISALFSGWLTILVTNFFGFSVVIIQLFFFIIPAVIFKMASSNSPDLKLTPDNRHHPDFSQKFSMLTVLLIGILILLRIVFFWLGDFYFAKGYQFSRTQDFALSYKYLKQATVFNNNEPVYFDELSVPAVTLGLAYFAENNATASATLINEGLSYSQKAISISPENVNFYKTRTRILYALTALDEKYLNRAIESLETAKNLSPTDPKIRYNLALMYDSAGESQKAYELLEQTVKLKINYRDAYLARAVFYARDGNNDKAKQALEFILTRINPGDEEALKQLEDLK